MKIIYAVLFLICSIPLSGQHQSSLGIQFGLDKVSPKNSSLNVIFADGGGQIRKERKYEVSIGANYSYRILSSSMLTTGLIYNAYGYTTNYYDIPDFEDRDVFVSNRYLTVPLLFKHELLFSDFSLYMETGLLTNIYLNTRWKDSHVGTDMTERLSNVDVKNVNFGGHVGVGIQVDISKYIQLYLNPNFRYMPRGDFLYSVLGYRSFGINVGVRRALTLKSKS